jgi:hypothetical protein
LIKQRVKREMINIRVEEEKRKKRWNMKRWTGGNKEEKKGSRRG